MRKYKKNLIVLSLIALSLSILAPLCLAQEREFEIEYPPFGGEEITPTTEDLLPKYIRYLFNLAVAIAGLIAFGALIYGGFRYLASTGSPEGISEAKEQIFSAFLGLAIVISSYLILTTINPQLVVLRIPRISPEQWEIPIGPFDAPGVYLIGDGYQDGEDCLLENDCLYTSQTLSVLGDFNDKTKRIKITNRTRKLDGETIVSDRYGAILHEHANHEGDCKVFSHTEGGGDIGFGVSSVWVFRESDSASGGVTICPAPDFQSGGEYDCKSYSGRLYPFEPVGDLDDNVRSIKIEGNYLALLAENSDGTKKCQIFDRSDSDLKNDPIGKCSLQCVRKILGFICVYWTWGPCASGIAGLPIR